MRERHNATKLATISGRPDNSLTRKISGAPLLQVKPISSASAKSERIAMGTDSGMLDSPAHQAERAIPANASEIKTL